MNKKRLIFVVSLVLAVALVAAGTTMAYMVSSDAKTNTFGIGTITTDITENSNPTPVSVNSIPTTNHVAQKLVQVENKAGEHAIDAYVRVQLIPTLRDGASNLGGNFKMTVPTSNTIALIPFGDSTKLQITLVFNDGWGANWFYVSDENCFYYKNIVPGIKTQNAPPTNRTTPLLKEVRFSGTDADSWQTKFNLDVLTDSIQAGGNAVGTTVNGTTAWPKVQIVGGILTAK